MLCVSGNDEKTPAEINEIKCPYCGAVKFEYISYGYCVERINVQKQTLDPGEWESTGDGEGWNCVNCGRRLPKHIREWIHNTDYYSWREE